MTKNLWKYIAMMAKAVFVWCMLNLPLIVLLKVVYWITGYNEVAKALLHVVSFVWGSFTAFVIVRHGGIFYER